MGETFEAEESISQDEGTKDKFEVIYAKDLSSSRQVYAHWIPPDYGELPWLVHYYNKGCSLPKELEHGILHFDCYYGLRGSRLCLLIAFEHDGSLVRKTFHPTFDDVKFPFFAGDREKGVFGSVKLSF